MELDFQAILSTFLADAQEHLATMEDRLLRLEAGEGGDGDLAELFRLAHSLKGDAACVNLPEVAELAHSLEDVLEARRGGRLEPSRELHGVLLDGVDVLRQMIPDAAAGRPVGQAPGTVAERLRAFAGGDAQGAPEPGSTASGGAQVEGQRPEHGGTVRVDLERLDRLLNLTGELATGRGRVRQILEAGGPLDAALEAHAALEHTYDELQELVLRIRMVPVGPVFRHHVRTVRDLAQTHGRLARLVVQGGEVEADTAILHQLRDPLTHLVRNAVVHGVESPAERVAAGKEPVATISLSASHQAGQVVVRVSDDGRGLDEAAIRRRAASMGEPIEGKAAEELIFHPALSTADRLTGDAGRGVGLDVVKRNLEALRGTVSVSSRAGEGTTFELRVPLTLLIIDGFSVAVGDERFVVPLEHVLECVDHPGRPDAEVFGVMTLRGETLPLVRLAPFFGLEPPAPDRESVVVVEDQGRRAGLVVDGLLGQHQTVLKSMGRLIAGSDGIGASTVLGDGRVALVLDVPTLLGRAEASARPTPEA